MKCPKKVILFKSKINSNITFSKIPTKPVFSNKKHRTILNKNLNLKIPVSRVNLRNKNIKITLKCDSHHNKDYLALNQAYK
jgi:hypothetical protein